MTPEMALDIGKKTILTLMSVSAPMLLTGLVLGILVTLFQAVTSIREMTLTFIPKIVGVLTALLIFAPWILKMITKFTTNIFTNIMYLGH